MMFLSTRVKIIALIFFIMIVEYLFFAESLTQHVKLLSEIEFDQMYKIGNLVLSISGLIIGFLYYSSRLAHNKFTAKADRIRNRLKHILDDLSSIDKFVDSIYRNTISSQNQINEVRGSIDRAFNQINLFLEKNDELLGFSDEQLDTIIEVDSFIAKSLIISFNSYKQNQKKNLSRERNAFIGIVQEAKSVCYERMEYD